MTALPTPEHVPVDIQPMQLADVPECASYIGRRMLYYPHRLHDPQVPEADRKRRKVDFLTQDFEHEGTVQFVARRRDDGRLVGWASWARPGPGPNGGKSSASGSSVLDERTARLMGTPDGERNNAVVLEMKERKKAIEKEVFGERPHW